MKSRIFCAALMTALLFLAASALGQVSEDTLIIGNLDRLPMIVSPGQQVAIPVWYYSSTENIQDSMGFALVTLATNDTYVSSRNDGTFYWPFTTWNESGFLSPGLNCPSQGFTNQSFIAFHACSWYLPMHTNGEYWRIADFFLTIRNDSLNIGDTTSLIEGNDPVNGPNWFGNQDGSAILVPIERYGLLIISEWLSGDANFSGAVNGVDVIYLVNYFKTGQNPPRPFLSGDANGNCSANGVDVVYLVAYLKGIGGAPIRGDCD